VFNLLSKDVLPSKGLLHVKSGAAAQRPRYPGFLESFPPLHSAVGSHTFQFICQTISSSIWASSMPVVEQSFSAHPLTLSSVDELSELFDSNTQLAQELSIDSAPGGSSPPELPPSSTPVDDFIATNTQIQRELYLDQFGSQYNLVSGLTFEAADEQSNTNPRSRTNLHLPPPRNSKTSSLHSTGRSPPVVQSATSSGKIPCPLSPSSGRSGSHTVSHATITTYSAASSGRAPKSDIRSYSRLQKH
jgi:hypothetical protein